MLESRLGVNSRLEFIYGVETRLDLSQLSFLPQELIHFGRSCSQTYAAILVRYTGEVGPLEICMAKGTLEELEISSQTSSPDSIGFVDRRLRLSSSRPSVATSRAIVCLQH